MARRILIVEDDDLLREMYVLKFELEGYEVESARDGRQGLEKALRLKPDLMILDNLMPHLSGLDVLEHYQAKAPDNQTHIIILSNKSSLPDINRAKRLGAAEYLIKSQYTPKDIVAKVTADLS